VQQQQHSKNVSISTTADLSVTNNHDILEDNIDELGPTSTKDFLLNQDEIYTTKRDGSQQLVD